MNAPEGVSSGPSETCSLNRVVDGDGVRLTCGLARENLNVRLWCIDAPKKMDGRSAFILHATSEEEKCPST